MRKICRFKNYVWLLIIVAGFVSASLWAKEDANRPEPLRTRVYALHYITPVQAQSYLERLKLGNTVSQVPQSNALIVTAPPLDLVKITSLMDMVDSKQNFVVDRLGPAGMPMPAPKVIMQNMEDISVGTFMDPPSHNKKKPVILDNLNGSTVLISPEGISDSIIGEINKLKTGMFEANETKPVPGPNQIAPEKISAANEPNIISVPPVNTPPINTPSAPAHAAGQGDEESLNKEISQLLAQPNRPPAAGPVISAPNEPNKPVTKPEVLPPVAKPKTKELPEVTIEEKPVPEMPEQPGVPAEQEAKAEERPETKTAAEIKSGMEPTAIPHGNEELQLQLPETVDIVALLDLVGKYLNINYMYDPTKINGTVTLKLHGPIKVSELYTITESVLKFKGFAMSRRDNLVTIVPAVDALTIDPTIKTDNEKVKPGDVVVTTVYNLKYINAQSAMGLLTNMKLGTSISPVVESNTLIVTDYAYRIERIDKLLAMIDQPGAPRQFKFRQLKYTMASALVPKIQSVAQQVGTETLNIQTGTAAPPMRAGYGRTPAPQPQPGQGQQSSVYLDYDERTNRVLMVGREKEIDLINELIDAFDVPQQELRTIKEYEIQYVDAKQVVDTLATLGIISGTGVTTSATRGGSRIPSPAGAVQPGQPGGAAGAAGTGIEEPQIALLESTNSLLVNATPEQHAAIVMVISYVDRQPAEVAIPYVVYPLEFQKPSELKTALSELIEKTIKNKEGKVTETVSRGEEITIVADDKSFSLIVYANKKNQEWVGSLIRQLDKKRPQVLIDVTLVEIRRDDTFHYDLDATVGRQSFTNDGNTAAPFLGLPIPSAGGVQATEFRSSTGQFFYSDSHIQALLTAMKTKQYGRVLAKPKILVNDNEEGKISTTDTRYIAQSTTQVPTTGSAITSTTFQAYDAKIELSIKPHISEGDLLLLEVKMKREDFVGTGTTVKTGSETVQSPPDKTASDVDSKILVPDGATIILGGLLKLNQTKQGTKVPILGDIPVIGVLFRSINNSDNESKLYVFVKAYALRPIEGVRGLPEAEAISRENREAFEKAEKKFQQVHDIPGIKPKPMDPNKVLDEI